MRRRSREDAFFLEGAYILGAQLHAHFFAINHNSLSLEVRFPDLIGLFLREGHIMTELFALTTYIAALHRRQLYLFLLLWSMVYLNVMNLGGSDILIIIPVLLVAMSTHEAMHAFAGFWLGDDTAKREGRLSLNPLRHIDPVTTLLLPVITLVIFGVPLLAAKPVPFNPNRVRYEEFGAALVGLAGPLTNLLLAVLAAIFLRGIGGQLSAEVTRVAGTFIFINIALFVFNMIPFPPLDGSRLLYAVAPEPVQRVMYQIETGGFMTIAIFLLVFLYTGLGAAVVHIDQSLFNLLVG